MLLALVLLREPEVSPPLHLFQPGDLGSKNYRIPSLITLMNGEVIAASDVNVDEPGDSGNIDVAIMRSRDNGQTFTNRTRIVDLGGNVSFMDVSMVQDPATGSIFAFGTIVPENFWAPNSTLGTGYEQFQGERCLCLYDGAGMDGQFKKGTKYYMKFSDKKVYKADGSPAGYSVDDDWFLVPDGGSPINSVFATNTTLKAQGTIYLGFAQSSDNGHVWSKVQLVNNVKEEWMHFLGICPGKGIVLQNHPEHKGRIVFPIYYTNTHKFQSCAVIYSDDHGKTWTRGESPNDHRDDQEGNSETLQGGNQLTESQAVELSNGQIKLFSRNNGAGFVHAAISTSLDGGATWVGEVVHDEQLYDPYCQMTAIGYPEKVDGHEAVVFANPDSGRGGVPGRSQGTVKLGYVVENGTYAGGEPRLSIQWKWKRLVKEGEYLYSCLTALPDGYVGLLYEPLVACTTIDYIRFNLEYIQDGTAIE